MLAGTYLDCPDGYKLLAGKRAPDQLALIDRLLHSPVGDLRLDAQRERVAKRSARQSTAAIKIKNENAAVSTALAEILQDDARLSQLCLALANRGDQPGPMALAARIFVQFCDALAEVDCTPAQRTLIATNRSELEVAGIDPEAPDDGERETTWERTARTRGASRFRDSYLDTPAELSAEELQGIGA